MEYLRAHRMDVCAGYRIVHHSYFPGNFRFLGKLFIYHELMVVYRKAGD